MERVPELSQKCIEKAEQLNLPSSMVEEEILPLVMDYLKDFTNTARKAAQQSLVEILPLFEKSVCENKILPCMLGLGTSWKFLTLNRKRKFLYLNCEFKFANSLIANAHTDDYRTEAVTLLAKIVPRLGTTYQHFSSLFNVAGIVIFSFRQRSNDRYSTSSVSYKLPR